MSSTIHNGSALNALVQQPGAQFTVTRKGFDVGRRVFKCWAANVEELTPEKGDSDAVYAGMKVESVNVTFERAGLATLEVNYLGTMQSLSKDAQNEKTETFIYSTDYNEGSVTLSFLFTATLGQLNELTTDDFGRHYPRVTHTYLTEEMPTSKPGDAINPPMFDDLIPDGVIDYPGIVKFIPNRIIGMWRLNGREIRTIEELKEISDTYNYTFYSTSYVIQYY